MWELRWILLGMGVVLIAGLYLWSRNPFSISFRSFSTAEKPKRTEPSISASEEPEIADTESSEREPTDSPQTTVPGARRVVTLRLMGRAQAEISSTRAVLALRAAGLVHGKYGIFHFLAVDETEVPLFSVANLTEPGSFNVANLEDTTLPGMSFFMVLPGPGDPIACFEELVQAARGVAKELDAELFDEHGSSWSIQRERYIREEIIEFRHQQARP